MPKMITIVLPTLEDRLSVANLVSEISDRFAGSDLTLRICPADTGRAESFAAADLILPPDTRMASSEIIRLAAHLGHQRAIADGPCAIADASKTDAAAYMAYARTVEQIRSVGHAPATCVNEPEDTTRQALSQGLEDEMRVAERACSQRSVDGIPSVSAAGINEANMMCDQRRSAHCKRRSPNFCLSIVIPCFNEEEVITNTYTRIIDVLGSKEFELQIIFVDDGSNDHTGAILARIAVDDERVTVVTLSRNFGHQAAISAGLARSHGNATAIIDADLQDPPEVIPGMIDKWLEGYDVVYGVRVKRKEPLWKKLCYMLFYRVLHKLASIEVPLDAGDFSLIDERVLDEINRLPEKNRFFRGLRAWIGFAQIGFEYERAPRVAGGTKYPLFKLLKLAADGILNFSTIPLTIVFYAGCAISFFALTILTMIMFLGVTDLAFFHPEAKHVQGFAFIMVTVLFMAGIQLICTGIVGEYVGRIFHEVKARPYFIAQNDLSARNGPTATLATSECGSGRRGAPEHPFDAVHAVSSRRVKGRPS